MTGKFIEAIIISLAMTIVWYFIGLRVVDKKYIENNPEYVCHVIFCFEKKDLWNE